MTIFGLLASGSVIVVCLLALRAWQAVRLETGQPRGVDPGDGETVVEVVYTSGGGGGGDTARFSVPKDPQKYAQMFVPKQKDGSDV